MPPPSILHGAHRQVDQPCIGDVEQVQSPGAASDLAKQPHLLIVDPHEPVLDENLEPTFIQLAIADDVGGEARDVVGIVESLVVSVLAGGLPLICTTEPSLNRTMPTTLVSRSAKTSSMLVMWLEAPMSKIHHFRSPSPLSPSTAFTSESNSSTHCLGADEVMISHCCTAFG
jgi:hypothetical protein